MYDFACEWIQARDVESVRSGRFSDADGVDSIGSENEFRVDDE